jgi:hypothetical protein
LGTQAALIAGVVSSAFSWPTIEDAPWTAKALLYSSLTLSLASIAAGSQQSIALHRLGEHEVSQKVLRDLLSKPAGDSDNENGKPRKVRASRLQNNKWQMPVMLLNVSILFMLVSLFIIIWDRAASYPSSDDEMKVT